MKVSASYKQFKAMHEETRWVIVIMSLILIFTNYKNQKTFKNEQNVERKVDIQKSRIEMSDSNDISMIDVKPSQWFLPEQINTAKVECKEESDWPNALKCPSHHPYVWSKTKTIKRVTSVHSKYGKLQCSVSIICSNIYDADAIGIVMNTN